MVLEDLHAGWRDNFCVSDSETYPFSVTSNFQVIRYAWIRSGYLGEEVL